MDNTKKEHYVPRFYLEKFANLSPSGKEYKIWIFNKLTQNLYPSDVKDTATNNYFYDFPVELVGEDNKKIFDADLQKLENVIAPFYKNFEKRLFYILKSDYKHKYQRKVIKKRAKKYWSYILAIQALRTPEFRNLLKEVKNKSDDININKSFFEQETRKHIKQIKADFPDFNSALLKAIQNFLIDTSSKIVDELYTDKLMAITHNEFFRKHLHDLSKLFVKHKWILGVNQTDIPFYTSDHPVAKIPYFETGYATEGIEILFPINSRLILILRDKKHPRSNEGDGKLVILSEDEVNNYNKTQVYCSNQFI
jgi:Protein of unknown function (DUF4238)